MNKKMEMSLAAVLIGTLLSFAAPIMASAQGAAPGASSLATLHAAKIESLANAIAATGAEPCTKTLYIDLDTDIGIECRNLWGPTWSLDARNLLAYSGFTLAFIVADGTNHELIYLPYLASSNNLGEAIRDGAVVTPQDLAAADQELMQRKSRLQQVPAAAQPNSFDSK